MTQSGGMPLLTGSRSAVRRRRGCSRSSQFGKIAWQRGENCAHVVIAGRVACAAKDRGDDGLAVRCPPSCHQMVDVLAHIRSSFGPENIVLADQFDGGGERYSARVRPADLKAPPRALPE